MGKRLIDVMVKTQIELDVKLLAEQFCAMSDEEQAQFFIECAAIAAAWPTKYGGAGYQWYLAGRHLSTCECSNEDAREMVRELASGIEAGKRFQASA